MDPFIEKIEELKKEAQLVKQTCPCQNNATTATPPRSSRRKSKRDVNASSAGGQLSNGTCCPSPSNVQTSSKVSALVALVDSLHSCEVSSMALIS